MQMLWVTLLRARACQKQAANTIRHFMDNELPARFANIPPCGTYLSVGIAKVSESPKETANDGKQHKNSTPCHVISH
jgi:hypothetical protein